ncbi:hypothetical protein C6A77_06715 [Pseudomonas sp. AFG_SD02_1510_Pfu_092]|nr:hypothetical protein C6A77_06715 [Pseudomonas sp. AFG_SD02_1510_Pfu_092]
MCAGKPAKQATRRMAPAAPVFAATAASTGTACAIGLRVAPALEIEQDSCSHLDNPAPKIQQVTARQINTCYH